MRPRRLSFVLFKLEPNRCGVSDYLLNLVNHIGNEIECSVVVVSKSDESSNNSLFAPNVSILSAKNSADMFIKFYKYLRLFRPDVINFQFPSSGRVFLIYPFLPIFCRLLRLRCCQTWHEPLGRFKFLPTLLANDFIFVDRSLITELPLFYRLVLKLKRQDYIPIASSIPVSKINVDQLKDFRKIYKKNAEFLLVYFANRDVREYPQILIMPTQNQ